MGSGKGGGGGGGRVGGGGGSQAAAGAAGATNNGLQPGEKVPPYQPPWYTDLPPVENANRRVNKDGEVIVGAKGALPSLNRFDTGVEGQEAAAKYLQDTVGVPRHIAAELFERDSASQIANMLPEGSEYLGHGIEGVGISVGGRKAVRVQYDGKTPLNAYDIGRSGVYSDWKKKYGNVWVEQKERIQYTAQQAQRVPDLQRRIFDSKVQMQESFTPDARNSLLTEGRGVYTNKPIARWEDVDMHNGNWGFDFQGRPRVFDQGAVRPFWDTRYKAGS